MDRLVMDVQIINLADRIDLIDLVSKWRWNEWLSDSPLEYVKYSTKHNLQRDRIPMTFMALVNDRPVGTVALWMNDLSCRQDLSPWLASLYVDEEYRNMGIGAKLQAHAISVARDLNYEKLYLITDHVGYYERFGWTFMEEAPKANGKKTRIYEIELNK